jgi:Domain of unknown function (DUF4440)
MAVTSPSPEEPMSRASISMIFVCVLSWGTASAAEAPPQVRDAVIASAQALYDALGTDKSDVWQRTLTDDAVVLDEFGRRQTKAEAVKDIRPFPPGFSGSIEIRDAHVYGYGDTAVLDCEAFEKETVHEQKLVVRYKNVFTYVRQGGVWKAAAITSVTLPTAPPPLEVRDLRVDDYVGSFRWGPGRVFIISVAAGKLSLASKAGGAQTALDPIGKDVFMEGGDERNLIIFRRGANGRVEELIERRKFNDLHAKRE